MFDLIVKGGTLPDGSLMNLPFAVLHDYFGLKIPKVKALEASLL